MTIKMIPHYNKSGQEEGGNGTGQFKLCNPKTIQESHKKEIYCIAWSKDVHQETRTTTTRCSLHDDDDYDGFDDQNIIVRSVSNNDNASCADDDDDGDDSRIQPLMYRYMATCAGRHVCVYQVPIVKNKEEHYSRSIITSSTCATTTTSSSSFAAAAASSSSSAQSSIMDDDGDDDDDAVPELEMIQSYMDSDTKEEFYSCVFAGRSNEFSIRTTTRDGSSHETINSNNNHHHYLSGEAGIGPQLLCVAGMGQSIKVIDTVRQELVATLHGHGNDVYDLKLSPTNDYMLLSASKDRSTRLWNLKTGSMVAVFAGHHAAHCDDVVSISWHVSGHRFVSSGMDRKILIWNVSPGTEVYNAIQTSHQVAQRLFEKGQRDNEKPIQCFFPIFSTCKVHFHCVDCVQFVGDLILSRGSLDETIVLWEPIMPPDPLPAEPQQDEPLYPIPSHFEHLRTFEGMDDADFWFIRFGTDACHKTLACGNNTGDIFLWDIDAETGEMPFLKLQWTNTSKGMKKGGCIDRRRKRRTAPSAMPRAVRWVSFSPDGNLFMASTDEGKLYVWDVVR